MNRFRLFYILLISALFYTGCGNSHPVKNVFVMINTSAGDIKIKLYDETPIHRDNFIKLVKSHYYDGILFHRVIKDFMIQAGDMATRQGDPLNDTLANYTIPSEFNPSLYHKKGAVAAARTGNDVNPEMRSSGTQFYIVQGTKFTDEELDLAEQKINSSRKQAQFIMLVKEIADSNRKFNLNLTDSDIQERASLRLYDVIEETPDYKLTEEQRNIYRTLGGVPRLDMTYTVFGEVVEGLDIVDKIASVDTDPGDKPIEDIIILSMKIVKK